jgi:hypothetical protein
MASARRQPPEAWPQEETAPMTNRVSHGAASRRPVYSGTRRVHGLYERTLADGSTVFDTRLRLDGRERRVVLDATTKTDAIEISYVPGPFSFTR